MKKVKIKAMVTKIVFGGILCVPIACLKKEKTMISLKKEVIMKIMLGARASMVKTMMIFSVVTSWLGVSGALRLKFTVGMVASAPKTLKANKMSKKTLFNPKILT